MPAHSHYTLAFRLAKELADRNHEVTFINPYPQKTPIKNLKEISLEDTIPWVNGKFCKFNLRSLTFCF